MKTKSKIVLIRIAGILSVLFTLFHGAFYWIFKWGQTLACLNPTDRAIMLTFNLVCILLLLYSVILSFGFARQLTETAIGKSLLLFFSVFYIVRIVAEFAYFGFIIPKSAIIVVICLIPAVCFALPVFTKSKQ